MPTYVYGCDKDKKHPRKEVVHSMTATPAVKCDKCGSSMHKIPQPMRYYMNPETLHLDYLCENYDRMRARKKGYNRPSFSPDKVMRPQGIKQKDFETRR